MSSIHTDSVSKVPAQSLGAKAFLPALGRAAPIRDALMDAFVACRTTLDDLAKRAAAQGTVVSPAAIAAHLTGKVELTEKNEDGVASAINARLGELSMPPCAPSRLSRKL